MQANAKISTLSEEYLHKTKMEGVKLRFDLVKHLTTLSTGSVLLLTTLVEKIFRSPDWKILIALSLASFLASVILSVAWMTGLSAMVQAHGEFEDKEHDALRQLGLGSMGTFLLGLVALSAFAIKNFAL